MSSFWKEMRNKPALLRVIIVVVMWCIYAWPVIGVPSAFNSPDETANYFFASHFAESGSFRVHDSLAIPNSEIVLPRSVSSDGENLIPGSFLGLPLINGLVAMIFGGWTMLLLTPLVSAIGGLMSYYIFLRFFTKRVSIIATGIVLLHPAFWYYASRPMYHNALFCSFVIAGLVFALYIPRHRYGFSIAASCSVGVALLIRPAEVAWLLVLFMVIIFSHHTILRIRHYAAILLPVAAFIALLLAYNAYLYGGPFNTAYTASVVSDANSEQIHLEFVSSITKVFFPYGVNLGVAFQAIWQFGIVLFSVFALFGFLGFVESLRIAVKDKKHATILYMGMFIMVGLLLVLNYGSQVFSDTNIANPDISGSFVRYWLILFVLGSPFVASGVLFLISMMHHRYQQAVLTACVVVVLLGGSIRLALLDDTFGLLQYRDNAIRSDVLAKRVQAETEENAVIIAGYYDKVILPYRRAIFELPRDQQYAQQIIQSVLTASPVYVMVSDLDPPDLRTGQYLEALGFSLDNAITLDDHVSIQRLHNSL